MSTAPAPVAAPKKSDVTDQVLVKINEMMQCGELRVPDNYSPENALKSAYLLLVEQKMSKDDQRCVLEVCTKESIANCLFDMVVQGLSPMKKQCYFIPYGNKLTLSRSYAGTMAVAKRVAKIKSITANVIYKKDKFVYSTDPKSGYKSLVSHEQVIDNIDINEIIGAYAVVLFEDGVSFIEPMTIKQIETAWNQGQMKGKSPAHNNFRDEMSKKTAINRLLKLVINSSDDSDMYRDESENEEPKDIATEKRNLAVENNSNTQTITFEVVPEVKIEKAEKVEVKKEEKKEEPKKSITPNLDFGEGK